MSRRFCANGQRRSGGGGREEQGGARRRRWRNGGIDGGCKGKAAGCYSCSWRWRHSCTRSRETSRHAALHLFDRIALAFPLLLHVLLLLVLFHLLLYRHHLPRRKRAPFIQMLSSQLDSSEPSQVDVRKSSTQAPGITTIGHLSL